MQATVWLRTYGNMKLTFTLLMFAELPKKRIIVVLKT